VGWEEWDALPLSKLRRNRRTQRRSLLSPMSESPDVARSLALLAQAVASYEPPSREASHKLSPYREMLVSLREKGASLRTIAKILGGCGVTASHHSVARYLRSVASDKRGKRGETKRAPTRAAVRATPHATAPGTAHGPSMPLTRDPAPAASPAPAHTASPAPSREASPPPSSAPAQRTAPPPPPFPSPRVRGPRIADVRNL
jgi:hypothetical protein